jgi:hypothetical protein
MKVSEFSVSTVRNNNDDTYERKAELQKRIHEYPYMFILLRPPKTSEGDLKIKDGQGLEHFMPR